MADTLTVAECPNHEGGKTDLSDMPSLGPKSRDLSVCFPILP